MTDAFVDTTVLTDALLNRGVTRAEAKAALARYKATALPVYAIKEFKAGPLQNYIWFYNKLAQNSYADAIRALQRMSRTPRRYLVSTAIQAIHAAVESRRPPTLDALVRRYGAQAGWDEVQKDQLRLAMKKIILSAWRDRRKLTSSVVNPLSCYREVNLIEENGLISAEPMKCGVDDCCLGQALKADLDALRRLKTAIDVLPPKDENKKRSKALREIIRKPTNPVSEKTCRALGDAIFAFFAPRGHVILTTNLQDHTPLASALGKSTAAP